MAINPKAANDMASKLVLEVLRAPGKKRMGEMLKPPTPADDETKECPTCGEPMGTCDCEPKSEDTELTPEMMAQLQHELSKKG